MSKHASQQPGNPIQEANNLSPRILILGVGSLGCYLVAKTQQQLDSANAAYAQLAFALCHHKAALLQDKTNTHTFLLANMVKAQSAKSQSTLTKSTLANQRVPLSDLLASNSPDSDIKALTTLIEQHDLVLLCGALGGNSGAILAEISLLASKQHAMAETSHQTAHYLLTDTKQSTVQQALLAFVVSPFNFEGGARQQQARATLQQLETSCNGLLELPNDLLRTALGAQTRLEHALDASNAFLEKMLQQLLHIMAKPSLINLDMNDLLGLLQQPGRMAINWQQLDLEQPLTPQLALLLQHPLLAKTATDTAQAAMLHLEVPEQFELAQFEFLHQNLQSRLPDNTLMLSGLRITPGLKQAEVTLLLTGIQST